MTVAEFVDRIMRMPFVPRGRDYSGGDCWAVPYLLHRDVLGRALPAFDTQYFTAGETGADRAVIEALAYHERLRWTAVEIPQMGDVALLRCIGRPCHVGVMLDARRFLHIESAVGAAVERLASPLWQRRCEGVYRLEK